MNTLVSVLPSRRRSVCQRRSAWRCTARHNTVLCLAVAVACASGQLLAYPGVYGYPGMLGVLPKATPITLKTVSPSTITLKTVPAAPITYKTVAAGPVSPITYNVAPVAPITSVGPVAPLASVAPVAPFHSKFHAQDELGQYSFGYAGGPSSRSETRDAFGRVSGAYNYVDSEGKVQTQHYVADALGFRVSGTNLPVAPDAPEAPALAAPEPVQDTPEVAAAKASFRSLLEEAAATPEATSETVAEPAPEAAAETAVEPAAEDAAVSRKKRAVVVPATYPFHAPLSFSYGYHTPLTYSAGFPTTYSAGFPALATYSGIPAVTTYSAAAPATVKDASLLRVVNNPNHAVSYRVD
ncbi:Cuticle protein 6 [Portunus trituberculatus]|uniref:Cuticle protein 6 n=1 Tax=Portunus trituberculatus TaxID=210409 RepID=A0A5B7E428_PORTR|nr:Cuticle protein 6 [Portunus trituberculatus]